MSKTALLASYAKDAPLLKLGTVLQKDGWTLMGSAGTAKFLAEGGIPCRDVAEIVGSPILGHRVVTLSRELFAGLLSTPDDAAEMATLQISPIDLVYVTLYPLEEAIANPTSTVKDILDKTDIGGPTLLRAAAKGRRITLSNSAQIEELAAWIEAGSPEAAKEALVNKFAAAAERRVADYVDISAKYWESR